jgi:hypothetical protein
MVSEINEKGYSATVRIELRVNDQSFEISSIGPNAFTLKVAAEIPACNAEIAMFVDDNVCIWPVILPIGAVPFDRDVTTQPRGEMRRVATKSPPGLDKRHYSRAGD